MIAYRVAEPRDRAFIGRSWVTSYKFAHTAGMIAVEDWDDVMRPQVAKVLDRRDCMTIVAYETDERDATVDLYGFVAVDPSTTIPDAFTTPVPLVFYVYVKQGCRRLGIARGLFRAARIDPAKPFAYGCKTAVVSELERARKIPCAKFTPNAPRFPKPDTKETARG